MEAASIPLGVASAALGLCIPYKDHARSGGGLKPFWEDDAKDFYKGQAIAVVGGSSSVGQFGEGVPSFFRSQSVYEV